MALTVKQLNADASFLLTFEPASPATASETAGSPFRILTDPWITGPSTIFHSMFSTTTHKEKACITSLKELPEPDLVIISQHQSDHCNEATLRQLPATGTKTRILAEPAAARVIRGWKYFDKDKVQTIPRWENPRFRGHQTVIRITLPPSTSGGEPGEVSVAFIPQKRDIKGLHAAIGITYRPPSSPKPFLRLLMTPPATPKSWGSTFPQQQRLPTSLTVSPTQNAVVLAPPTPPSSPKVQSLRSVRSAASLSPHARDRSVSVIFSPHGISYSSLAPYATSHLVSEAALPLTALLHCFDTVSNPWWLGGNVCAGMTGGQEIASSLGARAWVSTHDGDKDIRGLIKRTLKTKKYGKEEVAASASNNGGADAKSVRSGAAGMDVLVLASGEEATLTSEGVWNAKEAMGASATSTGEVMTQ